MKITLLAVPFFIIAFVSFALPQGRSGGWKFDEFTQELFVREYPFAETTLTDRIKRYKEQFRRHRDWSPYIIYYKSRVSDEGNRWMVEHWFSRPKEALRDMSRFAAPDQVPEVFGGYRDENTLELWIVTKGGGTPTPSPTFTPSEAILCPSVSVYLDGYPFDRTRLSFKSSIRPADAASGITYEWAVSAGEIVSGRERDAVQVDLSKTGVERLTVTLRVGGVPVPCSTGSMTTVDVGNRPYLFDATKGFNYSELAARVDNLMVTLNNNPQLSAYIITYAGREGASKGMNYGMTGIRRSFAFRGFPLDRVVLVDGGVRDAPAVEMWLLPPGAAAPASDPSVDRKFIKTPRRRPKIDTNY